MTDVPEAVRDAQIVAFLVPDGSQAALYRDEVAPNLPPGAALLFAHGFAIHYGLIEPAAIERRDHGRAEGPRPHRPPHLRGGLRHARADRRRPGRERPGARARARLRRRRSAPAAPGSSRRRSRRRPRPTSSASSPCSAAVLTQLIQLGFETLVEAGYQPEIAYYECLHEVKLIVDLIYEGGIERMHYSISDTAEYGSHAVGPRVVDEHVRENMRKVLADDPRRVVRARVDRRDGATAGRASPSTAREARRDRRSSRSASACARSADREVHGGAWRQLTSRSPCSATAPSAPRSTGC